MVDSPPSRRKSPAALTSSRRSGRALTKGMSCDAALCAIAGGCVADFKRHGRGAARGDAEALHRMRVALTRLRTAIRFFSPAVDGPGWKPLQHQAGWLNRQSGAVRDIDVALERHHRKGATDWRTKRWREERDMLCKELRRSLRSVRYRRFIQALSKRSSLALRDSQPRDREGFPLESFSANRLDQWRRKLLRKGRKLDRMGWRERHRLRIWAKRVRYALEWSSPVLTKYRNVHLRQISRAKIIQNSLGRLNDVCTHQAQAEAQSIDPLPSVLRYGRKKMRRRLLRSASHAFDELARLQ